MLLTDADIGRIVRDSLASLDLDGRRVLFIIPDGTRTMPLPLMVRCFDDVLGSRVAALDYLVALGTHPPMTDAQLTRLLGRPVVDGRAGRSRVFNHRWDLADTFVTLGVIPAGEIASLTGGLLSQDVPVSLNRLILDYDHLIVCGPVFPHEVVGFSGGSKYFFPGIGGADIINFTHWLGAVITNYEVIGSGYTPVRAVIDRAASLIDRPTACFALVVTHEGVAGLFFGSLHEAWQQASTLSSQTHIVYVDRPFRRVLSVMPEMYDDLWTAAKGMYKLEPAVADGGEVVIYAPHITEVSYTHGQLIDEIGYHCRDYFLAQWERFRSLPGRGARALDPRQGPRRLRSDVGARDATDHGDTGDPHSRGTMPAHQPRVPRSRISATRGMARAGARRHRADSTRRRDAVPAPPGHATRRTGSELITHNS